MAGEPSIIKTIFILLTSYLGICLTTVNPDNATVNQSNTQIELNDSSIIVSKIIQPSTPQFWMMRLGVIDSELIDIQAIVVKDEDAQKACIKGNRASEKRYLMCGGSILDRNHVLTSASCLHEALHIRHNIRAPLAVVVAPLKSTVQVIRINEYKIHANHNTNPYSADYVLHNVAILSLACNIDHENYHKIELPLKPMTDICQNDECIVPIYRIIGYSSNILSQIHPPNLSTKKYSAEIQNNQSAGSQNIVKRSSDGSHSCTEIGAPVIFNYTQVAIVAISCDDRKPTTTWSYTDLYNNKEWIENTLNNWNNTKPTTYDPESSVNNHSDEKPGEPRAKGCANCTFNFYISIECKEKGKCQKIGDMDGNIRNKTVKWRKNIYLREPLVKQDKLHIVSSDFNRKLTKSIEKQKSQKRSQLFNTINAKNERTKRQAIANFITKDFEGHEDIMKMHALIIRDDEMTSCCQVTNPVGGRRYYMCSAAVLTLHHALTTASCIHFADIYEHHIRGELALLIGATTPRSYIIKIIRYEMHPNYVFDVDSDQHSNHNLAILFLHCSIKQEATLIPKLPRGINDDIGHICCGQNCNLITIIQNSENYHIARVLKALHIPPPKHDETPNIFGSLRKKRRPTKLASKPPFHSIMDTTFFTYMEEGNSNRIKYGFQKFGDNSNTNTSIITRILTNRILHEFDHSRRLLTNLTTLDEAMAKIDWDNIEDTMDSKILPTDRPIIRQFISNVVEETMTRMRIVLRREEEFKKYDKSDVSEKNQFFKTFLTSNNNSIDDFAKTFARIIANLLPPNDVKKLSTSGDMILDETIVQAPPPKYTACPPLGTPVIVNDTLIAMVSYTCDDIQNWVEWKYVSLSNNLVWLRKRIIASQSEPSITCDGRDNT